MTGSHVGLEFRQTAVGSGTQTIEPHTTRTESGGGIGRGSRVVVETQGSPTDPERAGKIVGRVRSCRGDQKSESRNGLETLGQLRVQSDA